MKRKVIVLSIAVLGIIAGLVAYKNPDLINMGLKNDNSDNSDALEAINPLEAEDLEASEDLADLENLENLENGEDLEEARLSVVFSHESGFYENDVYLSLFCPYEESGEAEQEIEIYFTLDGSPPNSTSTKYEKPILLKSPNKDVALTTIKTVAYKDGEAITEVSTQSYIRGKEVFSRFDENTLIFALSIDPYDLYDYYEGITNEGFLREQYKEEKGLSPSAHVDPDKPANYNKRGEESERSASIEVFNNKGEVLISQDVGARVKGGWSREARQKSWQLYARKIYGGDGGGKFKYPFFGLELNSEGGVIDRYDSIRLRNNGNDREFGAVRDELTQELARQSGFPDTQRATPAAVFLNGEYYGFAYLKETYGNGYLEQRYGGAKDNYEIVQNNERGDVGEERAINDYHRVYELAENGLTDDDKFNEFCSLIDIDNLMFYYAVEIFIDNKDWPGNNMRLWRYYPPEIEVNENETEDNAETENNGEEVINPYNDGKWRFLMYDVEFAWSLYGNSSRDDTLYNVLNGSDHMGGQSVLLSALLEREDMKVKFSNTTYYMLNNAFSADNIKRTLDELLEASQSERLYAVENGYSSEWANKDTFEENYEAIRRFADRRTDVMKKSLEENLGFSEKDYDLNFSPNLDLTKALQPEEAVNETEKTSLYISEVSASGNDFIELFNPTFETITTSGLYLSDKEDNLQKWEIPVMNIAPNTALIIVCKNNKSEDALMKAKTNFNLKAGETVYLSDLDGNILSFAPVIIE